MATISPHLRNFKEPTKDQLTHLFFALPTAVSPPDANGNGANGEKIANPPEAELEKMEINAVLSLGVQGEEDSYVSALPDSCMRSPVASPARPNSRPSPTPWRAWLIDRRCSRNHVFPTSAVLMHVPLSRLLLNERCVHRQASFTSSLRTSPLCRWIASPSDSPSRYVPSAVWNA